jgi:competence protein ComGC
MKKNEANNGEEIKKKREQGINLIVIGVIIILLTILFIKIIPSMIKIN